MVTYAAPDINNSESRGRMLSFPWLVWEILAYVKQHKVYEKGISEEFIEPVHVKLAKAVELYNRLPEAEQHRLQLIRQALKGAPSLKFPLLAYGEDLGKLMYVILRWCEKERVIGDDKRLRIEHIAMLFIIYASGLSGYVDKTGHVSQYVLPMDQLKNMYESSRDDFRCSKKLYRPGALCLEFIKYLASQYFRCQKELDFRRHDINSVFSNREWLHLHSVAFKTYHHIAWTLNFRSLHMDDPNLARYSTLKWDRDELDPIPIHLSMDALFFSRFPSNNQAALDNSSRLLKMWSGMEEVSMRFDVTNRDHQFLVVGIGSLEARNRLKEILLCDELEEALYLEVCPESKRDY
uniref:DUF7752 domain-containing protein n=1 Tax=Romanomermis culicivorax TaxID=13658 RepID=A0A915JTY0_ROMCU